MRYRGVLSGLACLMAAGGLMGCAPLVAVGAGGVVAYGVSQERTTADILADNDIALTINTQFLTTSATLARRVAVDVKEGRVVLSGGVDDVAQSVKAAEIAWATPGVVSVTNEIVSGQQASASRYANDVWISTRLRAEMVAASNIAARNYTIETHDGVVHITGLSRTPAELEAVTALAASVPGVREVVSHVLSIDDPRRAAGVQRPVPRSPNSTPAPSPARSGIEAAPLDQPA
jgi:osmotically-inducible protein OsmY